MGCSQLLKVKELISQLHDLGFAPSQIDSILLNTAGSVKLENLPSSSLSRLIKELDNYVWFSRRCQSIG